MINRYKLDGKLVVEYGQDYNKNGRYTRYVILEDGKRIWFSKKDIYCFQIQCFKCKKWSKPIPYAIKREDKKDESKRKCGIARKYWMCLSCIKDGPGNPMFGQSIKDHMTTEKFNELCKKRSINASGKNNSMYGKSVKEYMTDEKYELWKKHLSDANKAISENKERARKRSQNMSAAQKRAIERDPIYYSKIKAKGGTTTSSIKHYRKSNPEIKVEEWLKEHKVNYSYSPILNAGNRNFQYDFIIYDKRILIEVQGDYWHGNPKTFKESDLNNIQLTKKANDIIKKKFAESKGFILLTIWEYDINNNDFSVLNSIL